MARPAHNLLCGVCPHMHAHACACLGTQMGDPGPRGLWGERPQQDKFQRVIMPDGPYVLTFFDLFSGEFVCQATFVAV